jgi:hypothetical protein
MDPTSLTSLTWQLPERRDATFSPWDSAAFLVNVVETTCSNLESLDISFKDFARFRVGPHALPTVSIARVEQYRKVVPSEATNLKRLQNFRYRCGYGSKERRSAVEKEFTGFIGRYGDSLSSITIPIWQRTWDRKTLDFVLKICGLLPRLKSLTLANNTHEASARDEIRSLDFFRALTTDAATSNIERFSIMNMHSPFSPAMGLLFRSWKNLKFLQIGDEHNSDGPYGHDGRLDHYRYPSVSNFTSCTHVCLI